MYRNTSLKPTRGWLSNAGVPWIDTTTKEWRRRSATATATTSCSHRRTIIAMRPIQHRTGSNCAIHITSRSPTTAFLSTRKHHTHTHHPFDVRIVEVGPRDGLQNEPGGIVSTEDKVHVIQLLIQAGCGHIEVGSFVSANAVPNMANSSQVVQRLSELDLWSGRSSTDDIPHRDTGTSSSSSSSSSSHDHGSRSHTNAKPVRFSALVPTLRYLQDALVHRDTIDEIAIFASASETFSQKNLNCSIAESMIRFQEILKVTTDLSLPVRGYLSCAMGCPYEGITTPTQRVGRITEQLFELGCYEVALSDTIGIGTPQSTRTMIDDALIASGGQPKALAVHFHDTYGQALSNIMVSLDRGITTIDSSVAGLGVARTPKERPGTWRRKIVYMLNGMNVTTGIDIEKLVDASEFICGVLNRPIVSRAGSAIAAKRQKP